MSTSVAISKELDVYEIRKQFPVLSREVKGKPLVYFDNAATSQKPQVVIDALVDYYSGLQCKYSPRYSYTGGRSYSSV